MTTYEYAFSAFPNAKVDAARFQEEIRASAITVALDYVSTAGTTCFVNFKADLSTGEVSTLDGLVAAHSGEPLASPPSPVTLAGVPTSSDGRPNFVPNVFLPGSQMYLPGAGDHLTTNAFGGGAKFQVQKDVAGDETVAWRFSAWVLLAGGIVFFEGAQFGDTLSYEVHAPATPVAAGGALDCELIDPGVGSAIFVKPKTLGTGTHAVDYALAVPTPLTTKTGWYDWDDPPTARGAITPNLEQKGWWNLYTIPIKLGTLASSVPILGSGQVNMTLPNVFPKKLLPHWEQRVVLHNESGHAGLKAAWTLFASRMKTT